MKKIIFVGIFTSITTSLCCITPLLALVAGGSGASFLFSWIAPFRPYLIIFTILTLSFAWYKNLKPSKTNECDCDTIAKPKFTQTKLFLALVSIFAITMVSFPYYPILFYPKIKKEISSIDKATNQKVELKIKGMTCTACEEHVKYQVEKLAGIIYTKISYSNRNAIISFDTSKTNTKAIENAINATGYTVTDLIIK